ncbi:hypothetical protein CPB86DRAFT_730111 [Serendipita vermifera]|nr:hypothetical protein CPB86DRAFT_730111 [Serendipita vermifera]
MLLVGSPFHPPCSSTDESASSISILYIELLVVSPPVMVCKISPWLQFIGSLLLILILTLAMMLRVRAMWNHSTIIVTLTWFLFGCNLITFIVIVVYGQANGTIKTSALPLTGCLVDSSFRRPYITFITSIAFETFVIVLTIIKSWPILRNRQTKLPLSSLLLKDGLAYYLAILSAQLLLLVSGFAAGFTVGMPIFSSLPALAVLGVACNRMLYVFSIRSYRTE